MLLLNKKRLGYPWKTNPKEKTASAFQTEEKKRAELQPQEQLRIAIRLPNWLGDVVMALSFIEECAKLFPHAKIELLGLEKFAAFPFPKQYSYVVVPKRIFQGGFLKKIRAKRYGVFFALPLSFSSALLAFLSRARFRIGYKSEGRNFLLHPALDFPNPPRSVSMIEEWYYLFSPLFPDRKWVAQPPRLTPDPTVFAGYKAKFLPWIEQKFVLFAPFSAFGPAKNWSIDYFKELARLYRQDGLRVVVIGMEEDRKEAAQIEPDFNLAGLTSLEEVITLLQACSFLIANDSGVRHLASALEVKNIGIYGSSNPRWTGPLDHFSKVLYSFESCSPCYQRTCPLLHYHCLRKITPSQVLQTSRDFLQPSSASKGSEAP